jgi:hypothetical protein
MNRTSFLIFRLNLSQSARWPKKRNNAKRSLRFDSLFHFVFCCSNALCSQKITKRKSLGAPLTSDDDDNISTTSEIKTKGKTRIKKGVVLSDDDDDDEPQPSRRRTKRPSNVDSDTGKSLRAMMDIDDGLSSRYAVIDPH